EGMADAAVGGLAMVDVVAVRACCERRGDQQGEHDRRDAWPSTHRCAAILTFRVAKSNRDTLHHATHWRCAGCREVPAPYTGTGRPPGRPARRAGPRRRGARAEAHARTTAARERNPSP